MNFKQLVTFFEGMSDPTVSVTFDAIEQVCGAISSSYLTLKHLHMPHYPFYQNVQKGGYLITEVDYAGRVLYARRTDGEDTPERVPASVPVPSVPNVFDAKVLSDYGMLVSRKVREQAARGSLTEEELLRYSIGSGGFIAATSGYEHFQPNSPIMQAKASIIDAAVEKIEGLLSSEVTFDEWLMASCRDTRFGMRFGLWQKVLNITLKYMYLFYCRHGLFADYAHVWELCHCPVDKIIRKIVVKRAKSCGLHADYPRLQAVTWNFIGEADYVYFQSVVSAICLLEGIPSKMFFDVLYWERPAKTPAPAKRS